MQEEIENGCHQLETLLVDSADKTFDKFEIYTLRNILTVEEGLSPWMRLGHYEVRALCALELLLSTFYSRSKTRGRIAHESNPSRRHRTSNYHPHPAPQLPKRSSSSDASSRKPADSTSPSAGNTHPTPPSSPSSKPCSPLRMIRLPQTSRS